MDFIYLFSLECTFVDINRFETPFGEKVNRLSHLIPSNTILSSIILFAAMMDSSSSHAQIIYYDTNEPTDSLELSLMWKRSVEEWERSRDDSFMVKRMEILEIDEDKYLLPDGSFDVYHWSDGRWINSYKGKHFGYNHQSSKFIYNGEIYSFGGYGFWRFHGEIIKYMFNRREWEIISESKELEYGPGYLNNDRLIVANRRPMVFDLDSRQITFRKKNMAVPEGPMAIISIDFTNYFLISYSGLPPYKMVILDKRSPEIFVSDLKPFDGIRNTIATNSLIHVVGDSLSIYHLDGRVVPYTVQGEITHFYSSDIVDEDQSSTQRNFVIALALVMVISLLIVWKRRSSVEESSEQREDLITFISQLEDHSGYMLDVKDLDQILGISDIQIDETRRYKRSTYLNTINEYYNKSHHKDLIVRIKDPKDRRRFIYKIV